MSTHEWKCAFCGKDHGEVEKMITSPGQTRQGTPTRTANICSECVELCMTICALESPGWRARQIERLRELEGPN